MDKMADANSFVQVTTRELDKTPKTTTKVNVHFVYCDYMNTSNALTLQMSIKQIRLQVLPKLFGVDSWIPQMIRQ